MNNIINMTMTNNALSNYFLKNLQGKITLVTSIIIFFLVSIFFVFEYKEDKKNLYERLVYHIKENAFSLRSSIENSVDIAHAQKVLNGFAHDIGIGEEDSHGDEQNTEYTIPPHDVYLFDKEGVIIMSAKPELIGLSIDDLFYKQGMGLQIDINEKTDYAIEKMDHQDIKVLAISLPVRKNGQIIGTLHYSEPYKKFEEAIKGSLVRHIMFVLILTLSLSLFINISLTKMVTHPLRNLSKAMDSIRLLGSTSEIKISSEDEIGLLARSFNQMSGVLEERKEEVRKYMTLLENMVEERTAKLKESHAQLIESEKQASMGKLASYLAHEINNPIGIIVSRAECILMDADDEGYPEHILRDIEVIRKHSHRIASVTNNMLTFTRKSSVDFAQTDVNKIIDDTLLFMEKRFIHNKIEIKKEMDYSIPETFGNANQIQQVLLNILNNARDAMPDGGEITIGSRYGGKGMINVSISDNGHGMTDEDREHIFEPFFTTKEAGKGTGLGLSVAYGIIEEHMGHMNVQSSTGEGTTFEILLPIGNG